MNPVAFLADMTPDELVSNGESLLDEFAQYDVLIFCLALAVVILGVGVWAVFIRKPGRSRHHRHHHSRGQDTNPAPENLKPAEPAPARPHRRRQQHRPRNPTLAETGGLPPIRSSESVGSPHP